jgi:hypothetical protein
MYILQNFVDFCNTKLGGAIVGLFGVLPIMAPVYLNDTKKGQLISGVILGLAAGAYINNSLGVFELPLGMLILFFAYKATSSWTFVGIGWITHGILDVIHHNLGTPMFSYYDMSSLGCAVLDFVLGAWFLMGDKYLPRKKSLQIQAA